MTDQQKRFADEYLIDMNATRAYKAAYPRVKKDNVAAAAAVRLLKNPKVAAYAEEQLAAISSEKVADAQEVMEYLTAVMRREYKEFVVITVKSRKSDYDQEGKKRIVEKEEPKLVEIPAKLSDANKAAELLGKRYSMFTDKLQVEGQATVQILDNVPRGDKND